MSKNSKKSATTLTDIRSKVEEKEKQAQVASLRELDSQLRSAALTTYNATSQRLFANFETQAVMENNHFAYQKFLALRQVAQKLAHAKYIVAICLAEILITEPQARDSAEALKFTNYKQDIRDLDKFYEEAA